MSDDRPSSWRLVAGCELKRLLRDRRALFLAVVLPMLLYPVLMWGSGQLNQVTERQMEETVVRAELDLAALPPELAERVREAIEGGAEPLELEEADLSELLELEPEEARLAVRERLSGAEELGASILGRTSESGQAELVVYERGSDERGMAAGDRARDALYDLREADLIGTLREQLGADPADAYRSTSVDHVRPEDATGASLARFLPWIAVLILISAGSFAALDAFAAERELGTLETLLVQPVPSLEIARGKFAVVLLVGIVAWAGNGLSLVASAALGLLQLDGETAVTRFDPALIGRVSLGTLVFLPSSILLSAALCWFSSRAKTFREGQQALLPLTLGSIALVAPSASPSLELNALWAIVPLTGPALCLRDALLGQLDLALAALAFGASMLPAWLVLGRLGDTLDAERLLQGDAPKAERRSRAVSVRRSLLVGFAAALGVYVVGGKLQAMDLVTGLLLTLYGLVVGLALFLAHRNAKDEGTSIGFELGLRGAPPLAFLGALGAAVGLAHLAPAFLEWQSRWLEMPAADGQAMMEALAGLEALSSLSLLFVVAFSPGLCEELLFRGSMLSGLARDRSRGFALGASALAFALAHASVYRLALTFGLGVVLGLVRLGSRSLFPCILLHLLYNGLTIGRGLEGEIPVRLTAVLDSPWCLLGFVPFVLFLFGARGAIKSPRG